MNETFSADVMPQEEQVIQTMQPIIQEQDFPQKTGRLQELMENFRRTNGMQQTEQRKNPLAKVKVVNEVTTRKFEDLKPEDQQKVLARIDGVDYTVSAHILNFGNAKESPMTKHAEVIISKYSAGEVGELSEPMTDLVATLKSNNPKDIVKKVKLDPDKKEWGVFSSIRGMMEMKNAKKKMFKALAEHETIMQNLQAVSVEMKKQQLSLQKDIQVYEEMGKATLGQISEFELDCIALDLMIEDANNKLDALTQKGQLDLMQLNEANNLNSAIERMIRRKNTIMSIRVSTVQNVPMLSGIILGDEIICEKIDEVQSLVIPMWTWQYAIAVGALKLKEALNIQQIIRGITSKLITGNAKMLRDNMIAAQEELYAAAVAIEDLQTVQGYIDEMVDTVQKKSKEASAKCIEGMKTMQAIEQKNYQLMSQNLIDEKK